MAKSRTRKDVPPVKSRMWGWLAPAAFILDRTSKLWAQRALPSQPPQPFVPGVLRLNYVENTGAAFGILQGQQALLLTVTGVVLAALLAFLCLRGRALPNLPRAALWLLLGGALGNFVDRLLWGAVVDFLEIELFSFPVFNLADCFVCIAFALVAGWVVLGKEVRQEGGKADGSAGGKA